MKKILSVLMIWFTVSRPLLYPLIPLIFLLGYQAGGLAIAEASPFVWCFVVALTWPLSMILYGINDIYDEVSDNKSQVRSWAGGLALTGTHHRVVWWGIVVASVLVLLSAWLLNPTTFLIAIGAIVAAFLYSVPPVRLKERPFTDALFSGFFYVVVIYALGFVQSQALRSFPLEVWALGLLATALHLYAAARDYTADKNAGVTTTAVLLGRRRAVAVVVLMVLVSWLLWYFTRALDVAAYSLFLTMFITTLVAWYRDEEVFIKRSLYWLVVVAIGVGVYKIFF